MRVFCACACCDTTERLRPTHSHVHAHALRLPDPLGASSMRTQEPLENPYRGVLEFEVGRFSFSKRFASRSDGDGPR